jgi:hypothetical protein
MRWLQLTRAIRHLLDAVRDEGRYGLRLMLDRSHARATTALEVKGEYLITTDKGVFHLVNKTLRRVSDIPSFGVAISPDGLLYLATWGKSFTSIISTPLKNVLSDSLRSWNEIWRLPVASSSGRVHQISVCRDSVWLANTAQNCITRLDRFSGKWLANIAPFRCSFGYPILSDHNHLNGIHAAPNYLVFSAFRINREAALGVVGDGRVWLFRYPNMGIHDCAFDGNSFLFSDSYSMWDKRGHGLLLRDGVEVSADVFERQNAQFVRGISGCRGEVVVGNSFAGVREERFSGQGHLIVLHGDGGYDWLSIPAAQVYDVLRCDGGRFDRPPSFRTATEVSTHFRNMLGEAVEEIPLADTLCHQTAKRFDERDFGDVKEYLASPPLSANSR